MIAQGSQMQRGIPVLIPGIYSVAPPPEQLHHQFHIADSGRMMQYIITVGISRSDIRPL